MIPVTTEKKANKWSTPERSFVAVVVVFDDILLQGAFLMARTPLYFFPLHVRASHQEAKTKFIHSLNKSHTQLHIHQELYLTRFFLSYS